MVKGWRAGCCLGIQMILGELRLGLPSPELPILLVLPLIPMPWPTWELCSMFLVFIGNVPLLKHHQVCFSARPNWVCKLTKQVNTVVHTCLVMEGYGGTWWGPPLWGWYDLVAACLALDFDLTEAYCSPCPLPRSRVHLRKDEQEKQEKTNTVRKHREDSSAKFQVPHKYLHPFSHLLNARFLFTSNMLHMIKLPCKWLWHLLCGPYKLAPSCDSWPDDDGEGEDSIWRKTFGD